MAKSISIVFGVSVVAFIIYLAATGVTLNDCGRWIERNLGIQLKKPDMKGAPYHNYTPVVTPK
jgi:hypothetical protein